MDESALSTLTSSFSVSNLVSGLIFGIIGWWMFRQGRKNAQLRKTFIGLALMAYPYFVDNPKLNWGIGFVLCGVAYFYWDEE